MTGAADSLPPSTPGDDLRWDSRWVDGRWTDERVLQSALGVRWAALVIELRQLRRARNLTQPEAARLSGVGWKTISSFETGQRIKSIKLEQLDGLLRAYGESAAELFARLEAPEEKKEKKGDT